MAFLEFFHRLNGFLYFVSNLIIFGVAYSAYRWTGHKACLFLCLASAMWAFSQLTAAAGLVPASAALLFDKFIYPSLDLGAVVLSFIATIWLLRELCSMYTDDEEDPDHDPSMPATERDCAGYTPLANQLILLLG